MVKKELIEKLQEFPDDTKIILITYQPVTGGIYTIYQEAVSVSWIRAAPDKIEGIAIT